MLAERHLTDRPPAVPQLVVPSRKIGNVTAEFLGFLDFFEDCFARKEPRNHFLRYMVDQFGGLGDCLSMDLERLSASGGVRSLQRFISDGVWNEELLLNRYQTLVGEDMADAEGVCLFTEACFPKKGKDSAGVARQYCYALERTVNCQISIFAGYASRHGYALLDRRLFVPERWFGNPFRVKRAKSAIPEELQFKTKSQLVIEILQQLRGNRGIPFKYVVVDDIACSFELINAFENWRDLIYLLPVAADARFRFASIVAGKNEYENLQGAADNAAHSRFTEPMSALKFAKMQNDFFWYRRTIVNGSEGRKGYEYTKARVFLVPDGLCQSSVWLLVRRTLEKEPRYSFFLSNAPSHTKLNRLVWLSGVRWAIRRCMAETRDFLAMEQYEVRKYPGWNRHMLICMLAHFFLWHMQIRRGQRSCSHYSVPP